jgi:AcrR family transcriptional regulator
MASNNGRDNILAAAHKTFLQFGYRLTSMTQIAEEAGIPRQALYLLFPSKQELFNAVVARIHNAELAEIRAALSSATTPAEKLLAALDVWYVRNYTPGRESSGATKLYESSFEFANQAANQSAKEFEALLATVIEPLLQGRTHATFTAHELARLIATASIGFKVTASGTKDLQGSLRAMVSAILGSLGQIT